MIWRNSFGGSISAEHGWALKVDDLERYGDPVKLAGNAGDQDRLGPAWQAAIQVRVLRRAPSE